MFRLTTMALCESGTAHGDAETGGAGKTKGKKRQQKAVEKARHSEATVQLCLMATVQTKKKELCRAHMEST